MFIDEYTGKEFATVAEAEAWKKEGCKENIVNLISEYNIFDTDDFLEWIEENGFLKKFIEDHQERIDEIIENEVRIWSTYDLYDDTIEAEEEEY